MNENAKKALQEWRESGVKIERKSLLEKHKENNTRKTAIDCMCWQCMGGDENSNTPGITHAIRDCTSYRCPLYEWRPYK